VDEADLMFDDEDEEEEEGEIDFAGAFGEMSIQGGSSAYQQAQF